jgi:hypothetical protein
MGLASIRPTSSVMGNRMDARPIPTELFAIFEIVIEFAYQPGNQESVQPQGKSPQDKRQDIARITVDLLILVHIIAYFL